MAGELEVKLGRLRNLLRREGKRAAYLATAGNVSWLLCGGDPVVSLSDTPNAHALVTEEDAIVLAPEYERDRLESEEVPEGLPIVYLPWEDASAFDGARLARARLSETVADVALPGLAPSDFWEMRVPLLDEEMERYRELGGDAAEAVGSVLRALQPGTSEAEIAGEVSNALLARGISPVVLLVGGDTRLKRFRHPIPKGEPVNERAMVVVCGRRGGLYANLTRMVAFTPLEEQEAGRYRSLLEVEAAAFAATRAGGNLGRVVQAIQDAYDAQGWPQAWKNHHQGGPTGYFTRDFVATPDEERTVLDCYAYTWNPSLPGMKVEDTVLLHRNRVEPITVDPEWPTVEVAGLPRPEVLLLG